MRSSMTEDRLTALGLIYIIDKERVIDLFAS